MNKILLASGFLWSNDGIAEMYEGPPWSECSDEAVREVRAMEEQGWSVGETLRGGRTLLARYLQKP